MGKWDFSIGSENDDETLLNQDFGFNPVQNLIEGEKIGGVGVVVDEEIKSRITQFVGTQSGRRGDKV